MLIDKSLRYKTLNFMHAYSGYNLIKMDLMDKPKTTFMSNSYNYYYNIMSFKLNNVDAIYQRLVDVVFSNQIGRPLEVYIDNTVVNTPEEENHYSDL